jgi:hypothetical protein
MKHKAAVFLFLIVASWAPIAVNAYCIGWDKSLPNYDPKYYSVPYELNRAKYVIAARAISETWIGEDGKEKPLKPPLQNGAAKPLGFDPYLGAYYDVQVQRAFKGSPPTRLRLFCENSTGRFSFEVGAEYLLFVTGDTFDVVGRKLSVDNCGNSAPMPGAQTTLQLVEKLSRDHISGLLPFVGADREE